MSRRNGVKAKATVGDDFAASGTILAEGEIPGRAVPWKAPKVNRYGRVISTREYSRYLAWQQEVHLRSTTHRCGRRRWPYGGPVALAIRFYLRHDNRTNPDTSNLVKAFEDALQGTIYENDTQVCRVTAERIVTSTEPERVEYHVAAI